MRKSKFRSGTSTSAFDILHRRFPLPRRSLLRPERLRARLSIRSGQLSQMRTSRLLQNGKAVGVTKTDRGRQLCLRSSRGGPLPRPGRRTRVRHRKKARP